MSTYTSLNTAQRAAIFGSDYPAVGVGTLPEQIDFLEAKCVALFNELAEAKKAAAKPAAVISPVPAAKPATVSEPAKGTPSKPLFGMERAAAAIARANSK